ncbi:50S ribosomal protein L6 [Paremcibacter congregatus]|uniref:Large ribosomal subunit protein uL6 n=1 Tax=Paremcibacter congregatus TaxID=2043170 RepID=A0A2G4YML3_9PROT|nr:50S ribosomal protein L6 [Paremcibacter congregatus]PHZ83533.1 50S ribosomal protein L6 [Paremcibacter congregatus]QDE28381.1 50S ribosomal protein L6 [Paremcibacter congregatus]|tara:strand:+ start:6129 stop:6662 length:534 start_codon:yes stop_codon:yes gene_type:complete
MSRIGKKAVAVPQGVEAKLDGKDLLVKGPKGELSMTFVNDVDVKMEDGNISVMPIGDTKRARSMWGMQRTLVSNLVDGVTEGFSKTLQLVGVGYRAAVQGKTVTLQLGFSHDVVYPIPEGIDVKCPDQTTVVISGINKQLVGQVAAEIREWRKPEPYKGKGVRYSDEFVFRKEGKKK